MTSAVKMHVAKPGRVVYAARSLIKLEIGLALVAIVVAKGNFLGGVISLSITHPLAIWVSVKEPHIDSIIKFLFTWGLEKIGFKPSPGFPPCHTKNTWFSKANIYVP